MEFSRRGPATDRADDGHRLADPPPQGDPMLVIRDALLSQLQKDRLRQEIIVAELTKIERAMALRSVADGRQTSPMPAGECLTPCVGKAAQRNAAPDEQRLQDSNEVPPSKTPPAEKWELTGITIPVKKPKPPMKWNCSVCQVQATSEQNLQLHYAGQKHLSNVATQDPTTKASGQKAETEAEPSLGTEEKKTSSIKWSCTSCQANGTCQSTLEAHLKGRRHQKLKMTAEPTLGGEEKKTFSIKWSCSTCQASGTCHSTLESHLKGRRHQQNIAITSTEGDKNGMPKNVAAHEAKPHSMATTDAGQSKAGPFSAEQPAAQQNAEFDDRKLPDCNKKSPILHGMDPRVPAITGPHRLLLRQPRRRGARRGGGAAGDRCGDGGGDRPLAFASSSAVPPPFSTRGPIHFSRRRRPRSSPAGPASRTTRRLVVALADAASRASLVVASQARWPGAAEHRSMGVELVGRAEAEQNDN